jgi:DNA helicase-2/ATP-dependent DNA helicase PcrA
MRLSDLNQSQHAAVSSLSGPLLVLAGAGTGKTRVITYRIANLIRHGIKPSRILAVTFTNKAAREMKQRAMALLGKNRQRGENRESGPEISTFHSLCVRVLRRHIRLLGYPNEFTIYDRGDQESVARAALRDIRVGQDTLRPGDLLSIIGTWKTHSVRPARALELADGPKEELAAVAYERYQLALKTAGAVDFDDLLLHTEQLFESFPEARYAESSRFDHLLIDEYQDTNGLQYRIVKALAASHRNLCVVGDDDQSIYGWRGADVTHILNFERDWPDAKIVRLEDNYRSCAPILDLANTLIAHNSARHKKILKPSRTSGPLPRFVRFEDETAEASAVVRDISQKLALQGEDRIPASEIAILFRTNEQPRAFEMELRREKVPYVLVGGMSFYDRKEVRDILAYLRVLANPNDEVSLLRIINTPPRGIGASSIETLLSEAVSEGQSLWSVLPRAISDGRLPHVAGERIEQFRKLIDGFRARLGQEKLVELVTSLISAVDYRSELTRAYKDPADIEARWQTVEGLVNAVGIYEERTSEPSLLGFLEESALSGRDDQRNEDKRQEHAVVLMTLHSAKGLEFRHVYLVGMEEGLLPHQRSVADGGQNIDEERRLCYVGVTRARDQLTLTLCKGRMKWGKMRPSLPSRFLHEMRGETERAKRIAEAAAQRSAELAEQAEKAEAEKSRKSAALAKKRSKGAQPNARKRGIGQST